MPADPLTTNEATPGGLRGWLKFALVSLFFFHITAATFASLGVVLPFMIEELSWSWSVAGLGFSVLSFMVGIGSRIPSWTMRKLGMRATFGIGGAVMAAGLGLMGTTTSLNQYLVGAGLAGLGFTLCALIPGVAVINQWLPRYRSLAIGAYMTIGGLGGVAGPLIVTQVIAETGSWRTHWWIMSASILVLAVLAVALLKSRPGASETEPAVPLVVEKYSQRVYKTQVQWPFKSVLRTPQFLIIVAAQTMMLFGGVTTNTWAVTHMGNLGVGFAVAAGALSAHALINSSSRALGGVLATRIDPKWLLASALVAEIVGVWALSIANDTTMIVLFVIGEGYGFGMCMFATTILLVNYFGVRESAKTMGTMYLITTLATLGPVAGGYIADKYGSFTGVFQSLTVALAICLVAVLQMRPPQLRNSDT